MIDLINSVLQLCFDGIDWAINPLLDPLASIGISQPVLQSMLVSAALALSIYITLYGGMFSLANAGFMAIGAYIGAILTTRYGYTFGVTILIGMVVSGVVALLIGLPVLRLRNIYLAIATIGFGEIVVVFINNFDDILWNLRVNSDAFGSFANSIYDWLDVPIEVSDVGRERKPRITFGARGISNIPKSTQTAHLILFLMIICYVMYRINRSRFGRALASIRQDEKVAASQGINVVYYKNAAFFIGALIAGAAGVFDAHRTSTTIANNFGFNQAVNILAYAVLGGISSWIGPLIGGFTLKGLPELLRELQQYSGLITGIILLTTIVYLPGGIASLLRRDFWTSDGRFRMAQRIAVAGVVIIFIANVLPFLPGSTVEGRTLGFEYLQEKAGASPLIFLILALIFIGCRYFLLYHERIWHEDGKFRIPSEERESLATAITIIGGLFLLTQLGITSKNLWSLVIGNVLAAIALFWTLHSPMRDNGGRYSIPLAVIAGIAIISWPILAILDTDSSVVWTSITLIFISDTFMLYGIGAGIVVGLATYFSIPKLNYVALIFPILALFQVVRLTDFMVGYYVLAIGLLILLTACLIPYPSSQSTTGEA
jgi:branched-chain amino acid transport system permease protein